MAGQGLIYTTGFASATLPVAPSGVFQLAASSTVPVLIHSIRVTFTPVITSGVAQDVRVVLQSRRVTTAGSAGTATTYKNPVNSRNGTAATSTITGMNATIGSGTITVLDTEIVSVIVPFERIFTPDQRIYVPASGIWELAQIASPNLSATVVTSAEVYIEEL
jgi:hypothetical protein